MRSAWKMWARAGCIGTALALTACAGKLEPVGQFGAATVKLAEDYQPLLARPGALCVENRRLLEISTDGSFDARELPVRQDKCKEKAVAPVARAVVVDAISAYGQQLALMAGMDAKSLTVDVEGLAATVAEVGSRSGDGKIYGVSVAAAGRLTSIAVEAARSAQQLGEIRRVMAAAQEPLESLAAEMQVWTGKTLDADIEQAIDIRQRLVLPPLVEASNSTFAMRTYPYRMAQLTVLREIEDLKREREATKAFAAAASELATSHRRLLDALESPDRGAQFEAIKVFVSRVRNAVSAARDF
jgi:hypothetical protein